MTPQTLAHLRQYNVTPEQALKLEFFFYTNTARKASALAKALKELKYEVERRPSAPGEKIQLITGWSLPMLMREDVVIDWTKRMCTVGFENDCDFDGWGTSPAQ
jgi:hypothetical protein